MNFNTKKYVILPNKAERWLFVGKNKEYLVTDNSCTCKSFFLNISKKNKIPCKHINTLIEAKKNNEFDSFYINVQEYRKIRLFLLGTKL